MTGWSVGEGPGPRVGENGGGTMGREYSAGLMGWSYLVAE